MLGNYTKRIRKIFEQSAAAAAAASDTMIPQPGIIVDRATLGFDFNNTSCWAPNQTVSPRTCTDMIGGVVGTATGVSIIQGHAEFDGGASTTRLDFGALAAPNADNFDPGVSTFGGMIEFWLQISSASVIGDCILDTTDGTSTEGFKLEVSSTPANDLVKLKFTYNFSGTNGVWETLVAIAPCDAPFMLAIAYKSDNVANDPTFWINRVPATLTRSAAPVGTRGSNLGNSLILGNNAGLTQCFDGWIDLFIIRDQQGDHDGQAQANFSYGATRGRFTHALLDTCKGTTSAGAGSTNTRIRRLSARTEMLGDLLVWTDSATLGSFVTVQRRCVLDITAVVEEASEAATPPGRVAINCAAALSNTFNTTAIVGKEVVFGGEGGAVGCSNLAATGVLAEAGDVVWLSTEVAAADLAGSSVDVMLFVKVVGLR